MGVTGLWWLCPMVHADRRPKCGSLVFLSKFWDKKKLDK